MFRKVVARVAIVAGLFIVAYACAIWYTRQPIQPIKPIPDKVYQVQIGMTLGEVQLIMGIPSEEHWQQNEVIYATWRESGYIVSIWFSNKSSYYATVSRESAIGENNVIKLFPK